MKGEEFQTLVGQLGALSEGQRAALLKALSGAKKPDEVIRLIETQFDASPAVATAARRCSRDGAWTRVSSATSARAATRPSTR